MAGPLVRVEEAGLGAHAQVRLVVSRVSDPARLRSTWVSSGATLESLPEGRVRATTTVEALARAAGRSLPAAEATALETSLRTAVDAWAEPAPAVPLPDGGRLPTDARPLVMGVANLTPDSFSDGGVLYQEEVHPEPALAGVKRLVAEGADILDIGGESTRPGAEPVSEDTELARVRPLLDGLSDLDTVVSIDTTKPAVARAAVDAGAGIVNDVSGAADPELLALVGQRRAAYVLMHVRGGPQDMQSRAVYDDLIGEVYEFLADGLERCVAAGIPRERILVDPGIGFAKTGEHNLALLRALRQFRGLGRPVVLGASRKRFLGELLDGAGVDERLEGSLACAAAGVLAGASVLRVHDVAPTVRLTRVAHAIAGGSRLPEQGG